MTTKTMRKITLFFILTLTILLPLVERDGVGHLFAEPCNRRFRGAWIATVANIDWPSAEAVGNSLQQQQEMLFLLDSLQSLGVNAIIFQVRPTADALYYSELEPVSLWLTGKTGSWRTQMPYDPLAFVLREAHARGMEVHVWLNPYRLTLKDYPLPEATAHILKACAFQYNNQWYLDPGKEDTQAWICMVVSDIVSRYDIDAIHMDDYFYPYPVKGHSIPDRATYEANPRGFSNINDWRRDNVNTIIRELHTVIHSLKPEVQFGISPFGVYRNDSTLGIRAGMTNYDDLYADIVLWMKEGWIDYVVPQLYWEIGRKGVDYATLARWWADNSHGCRLYIGVAPYRLLNQPTAKQKTSAWATGNEIMRQLRFNDTIPEIQGECFYSTRPLLKNPRHLCDSLIWENKLLE